MITNGGKDNFRGELILSAPCNFRHKLNYVYKLLYIRLLLHNKNQGNVIR